MKTPANLFPPAPHRAVPFQLGLAALLALVLAPAGTVTIKAADDRPPLFDFTGLDDAPRDLERAARLDPRRIVNASNGFLKEREPEINAEEYAVYEKVLQMLGTHPALALRMLEGMMDEKTPPSPAFEFILGNAYYGAGEAEVAEKHYRSAVKRYPTFLRAWTNLGVLYYSAQRYPEAIDALTKAISLGDRDASTAGLLAFCLEKTGDPVAAEAAYTQALAADPRNAGWREGLLRIATANRQYGRAEALARALTVQHPEDARYWMASAGLMVAQGRRAEATVLLETALSARVGGDDELALLGDLYAEQGLPAEAIARYAGLSQREPARGAEKLLHYGRALIAAGKLAEAESALAPLATAQDEAGRLAHHYGRAELLLARRRWADARAEAEAVLAQAPLHGAALLIVGRTYVQEQDDIRARLALEAAVRVPAAAYRAALELAALHVRQRRYAAAVELLEQAQAIQRTEAVDTYLARVRRLAESAGAVAP